MFKEKTSEKVKQNKTKQNKEGIQYQSSTKLGQDEVSRAKEDLVTWNERTFHPNWHAFTLWTLGKSVVPGMYVHMYV